jgi:hypothetical protein
MSDPTSPYPAPPQDLPQPTGEDLITLKKKFVDLHPNTPSDFNVMLDIVEFTVNQLMALKWNLAIKSLLHEHSDIVATNDDIRQKEGGELQKADETGAERLQPNANAHSNAAAIITDEAIKAHDIYTGLLDAGQGVDYGTLACNDGIINLMALPNPAVVELAAVLIAGKMVATAPSTTRAGAPQGTVEQAQGVALAAELLRLKRHLDVTSRGKDGTTVGVAGQSKRVNVAVPTTVQAALSELVLGADVFNKAALSSASGSSPAKGGAPKGRRQPAVKRRGAPAAPKAAARLRLRLRLR